MQADRGAHLLHIDSSVRGEDSVTRALSRRAAGAWRAAHADGAVSYRDLGAEPVPHLDAAGGLARLVPPSEHTPAQATSWKLSLELVNEIMQADTILLGLPLYNYGAPSSVKAWAVRPNLTSSGAQRRRDADDAFAGVAPEPCDGPPGR